MRKVTSLKQQQRNKERISVFLDDEFAFGVPAIVGMTLRVGQMLDENDIKQLLGEATLEAAKQSAFRFLAHRPRSVSEVRRNLHKKQYEEAVIEQTIETLLRIEQLNDHQFAAYWVEQREAFKPRSVMALRMELAQKGVAREVVDEVLGDIDEVASARKAAAERAYRWEHLPDDQFKLKIGRYLQQRGFYYGIIREVTDELLAERERTDDLDEM